MPTAQVNIPTAGSIILLKHVGVPMRAIIRQSFVRNNDTYIIYAIDGKRYPYTAKLSDTQLSSTDYAKYRVEDEDEN